MFFYYIYDSFLQSCHFRMSRIFICPRFVCYSKILSAVPARGLCPRGTILLIFCIDEVTRLIALAPLLTIINVGLTKVTNLTNNYKFLQNQGSSPLIKFHVYISLFQTTYVVRAKFLLHLKFHDHIQSMRQGINQSFSYRLFCMPMFFRYH